jgi:lipopolysaccharide transport system permease protein
MSASLDDPIRNHGTDPDSQLTAAAAEPVVVDIYPRKGWQAVRWRDIWEFRDLLWIMALRDITVRYKQTVFGALWAILQPLLQTVVMTIFFGKLLGVEGKVQEIAPGHPVPYLIFALCGQVLWGCFASSVNGAGGSLNANANMVRKIYFPRLLMPLSAVGAPLADCSIGMGLLLAVMAIYRFILPGGEHYAIIFSPLLLLIPLFVLSTVLAALGIGILLSALTVAYRDFKYVVPFMLQLWFFVTPVIYPVNILPQRLRWLLYLNPMAGIIEAFRGIVLGLPIDYGGWAISVAVSLAAIMIGVTYFTRVERDFADMA